MVQSKKLLLFARVDPLTSILALLARSCQILTISWQPWIPWRDSYYDLTKIIHSSKVVYYHYGQNSKFIKNTLPSVQAAETQSNGSFYPTRTICTRFHNQKCSQQSRVTIRMLHRKYLKLRNFFKTHTTSFL